MRVIRPFSDPKLCQYLHEYMDDGQLYFVSELVEYLNNRQDNVVLSDSQVRNYLEYNSSNNKQFGRITLSGKVFFYVI